MFVSAIVKTTPCQPSPCGPNSQCREINEQAVCSCIPGFIGIPPICRPECTTNQECAGNLACLNQKCLDPCRGSCGRNAKCSVVDHKPICICPSAYTGNPFVSCHQIVVNELPNVLSTSKSDPCQPSPCGPNALCRVRNDIPSCTCQQDFIGSPPYCRPECISNSECASNLACINQKCSDPCPGLCGTMAKCNIISHTAQCVCEMGYEGDPFTECRRVSQSVSTIARAQPCQPSPCGANAQCLERNGVGACQCLPEYFGNPYEGCRPECILNSDCPGNRACQQNKCRDPCPGTCALNADCTTLNHVPRCECLQGFSGDPYRICQRLEKRKKNATNPNPLPSFLMIIKCYFSPDLFSYHTSLCKSLSTFTLWFECRLSYS